jgi:hypothetical protein
MRNRSPAPAEALIRLLKRDYVCIELMKHV